MDKEELLKQSRDRFNFKQRAKIERAIDFATVKHSGQLRASGEDYITHPLAVASILIDWQVDLDSVVAGILHDTLEDTNTSLEEIESAFGKDIAFLVDGVTKVSAARKGMREIKSYLPKTRDNLSKFLIAIGKDSRVLVIKLADRLHNLRTLQYLSNEKQLKIADESLEVFARLADRLGMGRVRVEIEEISFSYLEPKRYAYLKKLTKKRIAKAYARLDKVKKEVSDNLKEQKIKHQIDGRIKSIYSLHKKLTKYDEDINEVYDLLAIRVIVSSKSSCYKTLGILHNLYQPIVHKIKDYISSPKTNGYQSLHTTVKTSEDQIIEIQIRSEQMHNFAENGMAASFHYNEQKSSKNYFRRRSVKALPEHLDYTSQLKHTAKLVQEGTPIEDIKVDLFGDRIFIYSPDGDIYDLPEGSFPLDFAYAVHSDIGDSSQTFIVNGKIARFDHKLSSGDVVEVKTSKSNHPKSDWLKNVKTAKAKNKIRTRLKAKST